MTEDKKAEFFIELLSEEMPAQMQWDAEMQLMHKISDRLRSSGLIDSVDAGAQTWSTPRRLAVRFPKVRVIEPAREEEKRGPRADSPKRAIRGFLRSAGVTKEESEIRETPKGKFYFAVQKHEGRKAVDILPTLIDEVIADFKWPKSMRWGTGQKRWIRPLRGIVAIFGGKALKGEVDFGGNQTVSLGNKTRGHRFLDDNQLVTIKSGATYEETMKDHFVIVSRFERKDMIRKQIERQNERGKSFGIVNFGLFVEVVGLVEHPHAIQVKIDEKFMTLPRRMRVTAIESHQKLLNLYDKKTREFLPNFVMVADSKPNKKRDERIRAGVERVMRARLADLRFFLEEDKKTGLDVLRERLDGMAFFDGLGTMGDKTERLIKLTRDYADLFGVDKSGIENIARYAKTDLASRTVNDLPKLQGFIGGHLARKKYGNTVANAIARHHRHEFGYLGDDSRLQYRLKQRLQYYLGLMDRIDTLAAFWAIGKMPTGSKDPYALSRAGRGIVGIILRIRDYVPLGEIFYKSLDYLEGDGVNLSRSREELYNDFISFIHDRSANVAASYISNSTVFNAVFHRDTKDKDNIRYLCYLAFNIDEFIKKTEGIDFIAAYKRLANILDAEDKKDAEQRGKLEVGLFNHPAEGRLYKTIENFQGAGNFQGALFNAKNAPHRLINAPPHRLINDPRRRLIIEIKMLQRLTAPINAFLDNVRVNDEDPKIRQNRLNLLHFARTGIKKVADFDKIQ